eukprot:6629200-Prymnesium_polylepis.1
MLLACCSHAARWPQDITALSVRLEQCSQTFTAHPRVLMRRLLEDCAAEPRPMVVRRNHAASAERSAEPHQIAYILLGACYVNETAQLRVGSAQHSTADGLTCDEECQRAAVAPSPKIQVGFT